MSTAPGTRVHTDHPAVARLIQAFEQLRREDLPALAALYAPDARFKDPFNEVQGRAAVARIFEHMFDSLDGPHFVVQQAVVQGQRCVLTWDFCFRMKRHVQGEHLIHGASLLLLDEQGLVLDHRDYWDAAEELYEKLPLLGSLMRWLKRRVNS